MKLQKLIQEEINAQLSEARVLDLKRIAKEIVDRYFPTSSPGGGGMGPSIQSKGKQENRFRAEMEQQIAGAMKGVIRRHNRGQFYIGDPSKIFQNK